MGPSISATARASVYIPAIAAPHMRVITMVISMVFAALHTLPAIFQKTVFFISNAGSLYFNDM